MKNILTFIIPVRHQENATNWQVVKNNLKDTIRSIANQDSAGWRAIIVANHGADLPDLPRGFEAKRVDFPPNQIYRQENRSKEDFYNAFRIDKGRRVLAGLLHAGEMGHVMIMDDDDFVSRRLTSFVAAHSQANGWYIKDGYIWGHGGKLLYKYNLNFARLCGSSHIIKSELYELPSSMEAATPEYIRKMLGSHIFIDEYLANKGTPLVPLPFVGAVYRTGHSESHSRERSILSQYVCQRWLLRQPMDLARRISRLRFKTSAIDQEFFGSGQGSLSAEARDSKTATI